MESYKLQDAQQHLKQLLEDARQGKTVLILDENDQAVKLVPVINTPAKKPRKAGSARGKIKMAPDFNAPLTDFDKSANT